MLIACPSCAKRYDITAHPLPPEGRKLRCASCGHNWVAMRADAFMPAPRPYPPRPASIKTEVNPLDIELDDPVAGKPSANSGDGEEDLDMAKAMEESNSQDDIDALFGSMGGDENEADDDAGMGEGWDLEEEGDEDATHPALEKLEPGDLEPVEDASYEELDISAEGRVTVADDKKAPARGAENLADVEAMANRRAQVRARVQSRQRKPRNTLLYAALAASLTAFVFFPERIVSMLPQAAPVYAAFGVPVNLVGLDFANVSFERGVENGVEVLVIKGEVRNISQSDRTVPDISLSLVDADQAPLYQWTRSVDQARLSPGASTGFETRLTSPPKAAADIVLRFSRRKSA